MSNQFLGFGTKISIFLDTHQPQANQMVDGHLLLPQDMINQRDPLE